MLPRPRLHPGNTPASIAPTVSRKPAVPAIMSLTGSIALGWRSHLVVSMPYRAAARLAAGCALLLTVSLHPSHIAHPCLHSTTPHPTPAILTPHPRSVHTAWLPRSCSHSDMAAAAMQLAPPRRGQNPPPEVAGVTEVSHVVACARLRWARA